MVFPQISKNTLYPSNRVFLFDLIISTARNKSPFSTPLEGWAERETQVRFKRNPNPNPQWQRPVAECRGRSGPGRWGCRSATGSAWRPWTAGGCGGGRTAAPHPRRSGSGRIACGACCREAGPRIRAPHRWRRLLRRRRSPRLVLWGSTERKVATFCYLTASFDLIRLKCAVSRWCLRFYIILFWNQWCALVDAVGLLVSIHS